MRTPTWTCLDGGYFRDGKPPVIGILTDSHGRKTTDADRLGTIAHELGHFDYARNHSQHQPFVPPGNPTGTSDRQIEHRRGSEFVRRNVGRRLADEAHANEFNAQVRDEFLRSTDQQIEVSGVDKGPFRTLGPKRDVATPSEA